MMIFGQTRIFFTMSRDGLLPKVLSKVHPRFHTPHVVTIDHRHRRCRCSRRCSRSASSPTSPTPAPCSPSSWCAIGVMILRKRQPNRPRPFRTPMVWVVCPLAVLGCLLLFFNLSVYTHQPVLRLGGDRPGRVLPVRLPQEPPGQRNRTDLKNTLPRAVAFAFDRLRQGFANNVEPWASPPDR